MPIRILLLLLFGLTGLEPQAPATKGSISGRITDADTKQPLPGIQVGSQRIGRAATDANGRYVLRDVDPGEVTVVPMESNGGYLNMTLTPLRTVTVRAGQEASGVDFKVRLDASISGRVLNEAGEPLPGIRVSVIERGIASQENTFGSGEFQSTVTRSAMTDDRGAYSFYDNVFAGRRYWILAQSPQSYFPSLSDAPADPRARRAVLIPTYYPNAQSDDAANPVILHSLERRNDIDIRMRTAANYCVEAILNAGGTPARMRFGVRSENVPYQSPQATGIPNNDGGESGDDGKIRVCGLSPGRYRLHAAQPTASRTFTPFIGELPFTVGNSDVTNLQVHTSPPITILGEVVWDKAPAGVTDKPEIFILPSPTGVSPGSIRSSVPGEFSWTALPTIPYSLIINESVQRGGVPLPTSRSLYVKDVAFAGSSDLYQPIRPENGPAKLQIMVGDDGGSIEATATENGAPSVGTTIIILSASAQNAVELALRMRAGTTEENGTFSVERIPPGRYYVLATNDPPVSRTLLPSGSLEILKTSENLSLLLRTRTRGQFVEVGPRESVRVRVSPKPLE